MSYSAEKTKNKNNLEKEAYIQELQQLFKLKTGLAVVNINIKYKNVFFQTKKNGVSWGYVLSFKNWKHTETYYKKFVPHIYSFFTHNCINGEESLLILSRFLHDLNEEFC